VGRISLDPGKREKAGGRQCSLIDTDGKPEKIWIICVIWGLDFRLLERLQK
jgi:hypothetical protein